jgi:hypothetical protein
LLALREALLTNSANTHYTMIGMMSIAVGQRQLEYCVCGCGCVSRSHFKSRRYFASVVLHIEMRERVLFPQNGAEIAGTLRACQHNQDRYMFVLPQVGLLVEGGASISGLRMLGNNISKHWMRP